MSDVPTYVLLVEDDADDAARIQATLVGAGTAAIRIEWVTTLATALVCLEKDDVAFKVVLLDLDLPDGHGVDAFERIYQATPDALILILCTVGDEDTARLAVARGAYDYLIKEHVDAYWLPRILRYVLERKAAQDAYGMSEALFRAISDASPLGILVSDTLGNCTYSNAAYQKISGLTLKETLGSDWRTAIHPEDRQRILAEWQGAVSENQNFTSEVRFLRADGSLLWARINTAAMTPLPGKGAHGHVQTVEDITERKTTEAVLRQAEEALFEEKERAEVTLNSIGDAVLTTDLAGKVTYLNVVAETMTGWSQEEALGQPLSDVFKIVDGDTRQPSVDPAQRAIAEDRTVGLSTDCVLLRRDGSEAPIEDSSAPIHNRQGSVTGAVIVFHDVGQSRAMAQKMSYLAQHDFLTGLPNRVLLTERLSQAIRLAIRHRTQVGLMFLDIDYFKHINDSLGHAIGDQLLQSIAERLKQCVRASDTICRQGGDEFVILLAEIERPQDAAHVAETLRTALALPHFIGKHELHVSLSIGISVFPDDGVTADLVMQNADIAMYHAKSCGRNNYQFFRAEMNTRAVERMFVETGLRRALKHEEFLLYYQPKINLASGVMTGSEALIRWQAPEIGLIQPGQFVPIAEDSGLIVPIGRWVLREACRQVKAWQESGLKVVPVSVNISAVEFKQKNFLEGVALILSETGLPPRLLELELTESVLMHDAEASASVLLALKAMGIQLAIDDFGTGYSSLSYLKRFPTDTLKIDQSFVRDILIGNGDATIVSAVIGMGRSLKQRVIAEGVETQEQLDFLQLQKCDEGQGFQFSHPLPAAEFARLLMDATPPWSAPQ